MVSGAPVDDATLDQLADALVALEPRPRELRWVSLSLCIVDAVWSIGANYDTVVVPMVRERVAQALGVESPTALAAGFRAKDPTSLQKLKELGLDRLTELTNRQRTSTRSGILKSEAVLEHCRIFRHHEIETLEQAIALMEDDSRFAQVDKALRAIPGEGRYGIRRNYLWMVLGNDDLIKPDRMVLRWLEGHGVKTDPDGARSVIAALVSKVELPGGRRPTPWEIDHAIWLAARAKKKRR
ncbi:hypothetical protein [Mycobacterium sp. TY815]|uniref:hypothetical protein n=1 Tax=Mycobacterium sp. TY815 TaxID=3050581 RepID=UPI0027405635|nr:hypothetical protein [Mycobacterium sp. TY815]MDP7701392.1 hypothetical protein [Mycobacterium sp. TY815]